MKTILILILLFNLSILAQSGSGLLLFGDNAIPLPSTDSKIVLWLENPYSTTTWSDSAGSNDLTLANAPTINVANKNGKNTITFNGIDESGTVHIAGLDQPVTYILAFKQVTWKAFGRIIDGDALNTMRILQVSFSPRLDAISDSTAAITLNPALAVDTWGIITASWNGASGYLRLNENAKVTADFTDSPPLGVTLAASGVPNNWGNIEVGGLIVTTATDDATILNHIRYLNNLLNIY